MPSALRLPYAEPLRRKSRSAIQHPWQRDLQEGVFMEDYYPYLQTLLLCTPAEELKKRLLVDEGMEHMLQGNARKHMDYGSLSTGMHHTALSTQQYPAKSYPYSDPYG